MITNYIKDTYHIEKDIFTQEEATLVHMANWEIHSSVWPCDITYPWIPVLPLLT